MKTASTPNPRPAARASPEILSSTPLYMSTQSVLGIRVPPKPLHRCCFATTRTRTDECFPAWTHGSVDSAHDQHGHCFIDAFSRDCTPDQRARAAAALFGSLLCDCVRPSVGP